jgi:hypothetical protein
MQRIQKHRSAGDFIRNLFFNNGWRRIQEESDIAQALGIVFEAVFAGLSNWDNQNWNGALNKALYAAHTVNPTATQKLLISIRGRQKDEVWECLVDTAKKLKQAEKIIMVLPDGRLRKENDRQTLNRLLDVLGDSMRYGGRNGIEAWFNEALEDDKEKAARDKKSRDGQRAKKQASKPPKASAAAEAPEDDRLTSKPFENLDEILQVDDSAAADSPPEEAPEAEATPPATEPEATQRQGTSKDGMKKVEGGLAGLGDHFETEADADDSPADAAPSEEAEGGESVTPDPVKPTTQTSENAGAVQ